MASKAARVVGIVVLMLAGLCTILVGWVFVLDHVFPTPVGLHSSAMVDVDSWDKGLVSAQGTWRAGREHDRILYLTLGKPLNISTINCIQQSGFCNVATTTIKYSPSGYYLDLEVNRLEIKNWSSATLEFSAGDPSYHCFIENYVITRTTKTVTGLSTASGNCSAAPLPKGVRRIADIEPLQLSLVSGSETALRSRIDEEAPTRALISGIVAVMTVAWLLFTAIWIIRVIRR